MITLYRPASENKLADETAAALQDLVVEHQVITLSDAENDENETRPAPLTGDTPLPAVVEKDRVFAGAENIKRYLDDLSELLYQWRTFQGDACYVDEC